MHRRWGVLLASVAVGALVTAAPSSASTGYVGSDYFTFQDDAIKESSGVVASSLRDGVYFTHNDSLSAPELFAVDDRGCTLTRYELKGTDGAPLAPWHDPEDIARGQHLGESVLWIGDVGDNYHERGLFGAVRGHPDIVVYRLPEPQSNASANRESDGCPDPDVRPATATTYALAFPGEIGHDVEALLADPSNGQLYVITKAPDLHSFVFAAPASLDAGVVNELTPVGSIVFPPTTTYGGEGADPVQTGFDLAGRLWAVGADIHPERARVVIRTYTDAWEWELDPDADLGLTLTTEPPTQTPLIYERQGEAIAYSRDGTFLMTTCEDVGCTAHRYDPPASSS